MTEEAFPAGLLETFVQEVREQVAALNRDLLALENEPDDVERIGAVFRAAHTIKGAARVVGVEALEGLCHSMESFFAGVRDGRVSLGPEHFPVLFSVVDVLEDAADDLAEGGTVEADPHGTLRRVFDTLATGSDVVDILGESPESSWPGRTRTPPPDDPSEGAGDSDPVRSTGTPPGADADAEADSAGTQDQAAPSPGRDRPEADRAAGELPASEPGGAPEAQVRVGVGRVDRLVSGLAGLNVAAARGEEAADGSEELRDRVDRWISRWNVEVPGLRAALAAAGSTAGSRDLLDELQEDLAVIRAGAHRLARHARKGSAETTRVTEDFADSVRRLRLRPVADAFEALPRAARDVARAEDKKVRLEIEGEDVEADRTVVDALREPLLHLVRNAVDHGIESPAERERLGKSPTGTVRVTTQRSGPRLTLTVSDDGRGLDEAAVREALGHRGHRMSHAELGQSLFRGGLSTRREATDISGRGVGLDVVRDAVQRIRGGVDVSWTSGQGMTFRIDFPPSPSTVRVAIVEVDDEYFALPFHDVERLLRIRAADVRTVEGRSVLPGDELLPLVSLARILGPPLEGRTSDPVLNTVVLAGALGRLGVTVDRVVEERDVLVRPFRGLGAELPFVVGGAILPSGRVTPVLDGRSVLEMGLGYEGDAAPVGGVAPSVRERRVLVVDDSLTTRSLEKSVLEGAGYTVRTAVDGRDGWRRLLDEEFDLVVSDVEMPLEDGLSLCKRVRGSKRLRDLPFILVTGLETERQREAGLEAGADAYLGKSAFDQGDFLTTVRQLLGDSG